MKKIYALITATALLALAGCDSLDMSPVDYSAGGNYWKNEAQVENFRMSLMTNLRNAYFNPITLGELRGGTLMEGTSIENVSLNDARLVLNRLDSDNTGTTNWAGIYAFLLYVNHYIDQLEDGCEFLDDASRNKYLAFGYGLRAYYYFMLYRTYGGVPLEVEPRILQGADMNNLGMARNTAEETLQFIKDDIDRSEKAYGNDRTLDRYVWSYYATEMLKAQVYLWSAKVTTNFVDENGSTSGKHTATGSSAELETAKTALQNIVSSGKFALEANFADVFSYENKGNDEEILALFFQNGEATDNSTVWVYQAAIWCNSFFDEDGNQLGDPLDLRNTGFHRYEYKESFVKSFDKADTRRAATFHECYSTADEATRRFGSAMLKYMGHPEGSTRYYDSDHIIYRYADVLLTLAEIENKLGNYAAAAGYVNQIRARAYGSDYPVFATSDFTTTEKAILAERDKEFVAEGTRWFDLVRMQDASGKPLAFSADVNYPDVLGGAPTAVLSASEEQKLLWPVDVTVLTNDALIVQTYGY